MELPAWATAKVGPLPVWGWSAIAFGGGVGYVLYQRRRKAAAAGPNALTLAGGAQAVPATYPMATDAGGAPGGYGSGLPDQSGTPDYASLIGGLLQSVQSPSPQAQPAQQQQQAASSAPAPMFRSQPTGDPVHDAAIRDPNVSNYLESLYLQQQGALAPAGSPYPFVSQPTGDTAHDTAIKDPAVSSYLESLYLAQQGVLAGRAGATTDSTTYHVAQGAA